jgi:solute carrier family 25 aspartate/glutamate transporter 12/13
MAEISKAKVVVKEKLLGTDKTEEVKLSAHAKSTFDKFARRDKDSGEQFMNQEDFINAIAPVDEDYVSLSWHGTRLTQAPTL